MNEIIVTTPEALENMLARFKAEVISGVKQLIDNEKTAEEPDEQLDAKRIAQMFGISESTVIRKKAFFGAYNVGRNVRYSKNFVKAQLAKNTIH